MVKALVELPIKSLYLHYPFCKNLCNYCDFYKGLPSRELEEDFEKKLSEMFDEHNTILNKYDKKIEELSTFYIGGGTPSLWGERGSFYLEEKLSEQNIKLADNCEFTMEVNPGDWEEEDLLSWVELGVNRFSVGIQSINPNFLKTLDRVHSIEDVYTTLSFFRDLKVNYSVDFMLGLPFSKKFKRDIIAELEEILSYQPNHISLYILTVGDNYRYREELPDDEFIEKEYLAMADFLRSKGFIHYEVSNFSKPGFESKHNLAYWNMKSVAALGPSATGFLADRSLRYKWQTKRAEVKFEQLDEKDVLLEKVYMSLRINKGLNLDFFEDDKFTQVAKKWVTNGLGEIENGRIVLNSRGFLILDSLMDQLFIELKDCF